MPPASLNARGLDLKMPRKAHTIIDAERTKRIRETVKEIGTSNDSEDFERAFNMIVSTEPPAKPSEHKPNKPRK
jgi:hypothetical protein